MAYSNQNLTHYFVKNFVFNFVYETIFYQNIYKQKIGAVDEILTHSSEECQESTLGVLNYKKNVTRILLQGFYLSFRVDPFQCYKLADTK